MADRRTKAQLRDELRMVYEENDKLRLQVVKLENERAIGNVLERAEELYQLVCATYGHRVETAKAGEP